MKKTNFRALIRASRCESPNWLKFIAHLCQALLALAAILSENNLRR